MATADRHNYEYSTDLDGTGAPARVVRMVGKNKKVLEIGAGPGSISRHLVGAGACDVTALEIDESAIKKLSQYLSKIYPADLNDSTWPEALVEEGLFDVVVAADVLEHLYDPWKTIQLMKSLLAEGGQIVLSLPHVGHNALNACLLDEDFEYRDWGLLDKTHIRFFGLKNMQELVEQAGLAIEHAEFVIVKPEESEFAAKWNKLSSPLRAALAENQFGSVYQVVIRAVVKNDAVNSINLLTLLVEDSTPTSVVRRLAVKYLPEFIKAPLRRLMFSS